MYRSRKERLELVISYCNNLRHYKDVNDKIVNLYDDKNSFIDEFKNYCKLYVNQDDDGEIITYQKRLYFKEINKYIDFCLPGEKETKSFFVFRFSQ